MRASFTRAIDLAQVSSENNRFVDQYFAIYTQVLSNRTVNEIKGGVASNYYTLEPNAGFSTTPNRRPPGAPDVFVDVFSGRAIQGGTPRISFPVTRSAPPPTRRSGRVRRTTRFATT